MVHLMGFGSEGGSLGCFGHLGQGHQRPSLHPCLCSKCFSGALGSGKAPAGAGTAAVAGGSGRQGEAAASGSGRAEREDPLREPAGGSQGDGNCIL